MLVDWLPSSRFWGLVQTTNDWKWWTWRNDTLGDDRHQLTSVAMSQCVVPCSVSSGSKPPSTVANGRYQIEKKLGAGSDLRSLQQMWICDSSEENSVPVVLFYHVLSVFMSVSKSIPLEVLSVEAALERLWMGHFGRCVQQIARVFSWQTHKLCRFGRDETNRRTRKLRSSSRT